MEELAIRYQQILQAYKRLDYMTKKFLQLLQESSLHKLQTNEENELITHRDALIKRFEFCFDITWKFFKLFLKNNYSIDANSPRKVFQEGYQQNLFTREETAQLLEMIDARNETTHVYDEERATTISKKIIVYYDLLATIVMRIKLNGNS